MQTPIPTPDSIAIDLPLPGALESVRDLYLNTAFDKLVVFVVFLALAYLLVRLARRAITENVEDVNRRHTLRKWVKYGFVGLMALFAIALFADSLAGLGTILALLIAGIAVALQDVLKSVVGWIYLSGRGGVEIGSRIEIEGIVGDVIDIGVLKTTIIEVGGSLVYGRQSTGRLVTIPNYKMLAEAVMIAPASSPFIWQEMRLVVTFESNWRRAEEILNQIGAELHAEVASQLEPGFRNLERRYAYKYGTLTPIVYVLVGAYGIELALRFLVHTRRRRGALDEVSRRALTALAAEPDIRIAYATYRIANEGARPEGGDAGRLDDNDQNGV